MQEISPNIPQKKLPMWATIREALEVSWQHRAAIVPWMILWAMIAGLSGYNLEDKIQDMGVAKKDGDTTGNLLFHSGISFLLSILQSVIFAMFAVLWHRRILLGKNHGVHLKNIR